MNRYGTLRTACVFLACFFLVAPPPAHAYLDPGTGSYIFQLVAAALLGGMFALKLSWHRVRYFLQGLFSSGKKP